MRVVMTRGLPASGKSTWARQFVRENPSFLRWNNDEFQLMTKGVSFGALTASQVAAARCLFIQHASNFGHDLLIDNTNLNPRTAEEIERHVLQDVEIEYVDFKTSVEECINRDAFREHTVGAEVIRRMADQWGHLYDWI